MKVSVIVPVYNVAGSLHYCVDSILNQTYKDFELILVDDGSTDKSGEICDRYASENSNIVVNHIENQGVSKARNTGIDIAKGEYVCFIDSDDYVVANYLEKLINIKDKFTEYDNIWCGFHTVDGYENYNLIQEVLFSDKEEITEISTNYIMTLHEKWLDAGPVCKLYSRRVIMDNKLRFSEELSLGEDLIFNFQYLDCTNGKILVLNQCMYNYVQVGINSLTKKFQKDLINKYLIINNTIFNCMEKWECSEEQFQKYYKSCFFIYEFVLRNTFKPTSNIKHKFKYNRKIMKSVEFQTALANSNCYIHPIYKFAYKNGLSVLQRLLDKFLIR